MYLECLFILHIYWKVPLNKNPRVVYKVKTRNTVSTNLTSKTPTTSWWKLKIISALIPILFIYKVSDSDLPFVLILFSLSLFSFLAKFVKLNGIYPLSRRRYCWCMPRDPFKAGLYKSYFYWNLRKLNIYNFLLLVSLLRDWLIQRKYVKFLILI